MKRLLFALTFALQLCAAAPASWLEMVGPIMSTGEKKVYRSLPPEARERFQEEFWAERSITAEEYYRRIQYVDANFGSSKMGSGANTDPGRVYLSLGAPNRITRLPSSRIFVPLEIWYYESAPAANVNTELQLIFYQRNAIGLPKLYSPMLDTLRSLLLPESGTNGMFDPNQNITESDVRTRLTVGPVEDEVITAAVGVAKGITFSGNDEIISRITSPEVLLNRAQATEVRSRLINSRPKLQTLETPSPFGGIQVDLSLEGELRQELSIEILAGSTAVYGSRLHMNFPEAKKVQYVHRVDLLPGPYTLVVTIDEHPYPYSFQVGELEKGFGITRVEGQETADHGKAPFEFEGKQFLPDPDGKFALVPTTRPGTVAWKIRRGLQVVWKSNSESSGQAAVVELPENELADGTYQLEATAGDLDCSSVFVVNRKVQSSPSATVVSYKANLSPALRYAALGHQFLLVNKLREARNALQLSLAAGNTDSAQVELARADALSGNLDEARERARDVITREPKNFDALTVLAYVETKFQDYDVAAAYFRRALAIQDSATLREALATLPIR